MDIMKMLNTFVDNAKHVLSISYKPTREEFDKSAKLIIIGILLIGTVGLIIAVLVSLIITGSLSLI
jgi:protein translocase SEC61 complex gamma subunit